MDTQPSYALLAYIITCLHSFMSLSPRSPPPLTYHRSLPPQHLRRRHHSPSASLQHNGFAIISQHNPPHTLHLHQSVEETKDRIKSLFGKVDLSVSPYDTAWVAMLPSLNNSHTPCFPQCLNWLLHNQLPDGSWAPNPHPLLLKDALSSTLASILALKRWGLGQPQINQGLQFIESNFSSATDTNQHSPIGFDIIFAGMLDYAKILDLRLPLEPTVLNPMLRKRESQLKRCFESQSQESKSYLAYISEGLGDLQDWKMAMKYQMKNGSLFNSPSTTAAAFAHNQDAACLDYLFSLLDKFGDAVPTVDPLDLYVRLSMVDNLQRLGIGRHFQVEIESTLDEIYRYWQQKDEQICMDVATCAIAFRLLRMNGYDVSSDQLSEVANKESYRGSLGGYSKNLSDVLEVYRASQLIIHQDESALGEHNSLSSHFLKQKLSDASFPSDGLTKHVIQEVDDALKFPFADIMERMASRRFIEHYSVDNSRVLKTSYRSSNINNRDFLKLAVEDYNTCQSIYREELEYLERWVVENRLNELKFARQKAAFCYFSIAGTLISPNLSDARLSWAKGGLLTTVVDDFFDFAGSMEELVNLIQLVEKWDVNVDKDCCSENVRIIFLAVKQTICESEEDALKWQGRSVKSQIIEIWLDMLYSMLKEAEWAKDGFVPKLEEYIRIGYVSFALGPVILPSLFLVGPKLSEEMVGSGEYDKLFKLVSTYGRLMNDIQTYKKEYKQGKLNAVGLHIVCSNGEVGDEVHEEEAIRETKKIIAKEGRELLRLVLKKDEGSVIPRECKDLFWNMKQILDLFYMEGDGFSSDDLLLSTVRSIIHQPVTSL